MEFYKMLSMYYDDIFKFDENQISFIKTRIKPNSKVLDLACGTGSILIGLSETCISCTGIDLSEDLLDKFRKKINKKTIKNKFKIINDNMLNFKNHVFEKLDAILCIGNSLVHILNKNDLKNLIIDISTSSDMFIFQILNYDRICNLQINSLPSLSALNNSIIFERKYVFEDNLIKFIGRITKNDTNLKESFESFVYLRPILFNEIDTLLKDAGYKNLNYYGDYLGNVFDIRNSFMLIGVCEK
ncbi:class I SAM-dependent methyltransferase [Caldicellulosiruptoraceae bacterium PP1]